MRRHREDGDNTIHPDYIEDLIENIKNDDLTVEVE